MSSTTETPTDFWDNVLIGDGCWEWQRARSHGYGRWTHNGERAQAHRVAWELWYGPIPEGLWVLHHCDNHGCQRPAHLFLGDHAENMRDMVRKGRSAKPRHSHCQRGHSKKEGLPCRTCIRLNERRRRNPWGRPAPAVRTHCPAGHPYDEDNTWIYNGKRHCRTCRRERTRAWVAKMAK